jgi:hypothetical protein
LPGAPTLDTALRDHVIMGRAGPRDPSDQWYRRMLLTYYPALIVAACTYAFVALVSKGFEGLLPPLAASAVAAVLVALLAILAGAEFLRRGMLRYARDYWLFGIAALAALAPALFKVAAYVEDTFGLPAIARAGLNLLCVAILVAALFSMTRVLFSQAHFDKIVRKLRGD